MFANIRSIVADSDTLVEDALGTLSLFVLLFAGLALPQMF